MSKRDGTNRKTPRANVVVTITDVDKKGLAEPLPERNDSDAGVAHKISTIQTCEQMQKDFGTPQEMAENYAPPLWANADLLDAIQSEQDLQKYGGAFPPIAIDGLVTPILSTPNDDE